MEARRLGPGPTGFGAIVCASILLLVVSLVSCMAGSEAESPDARRGADELESEPAPELLLEQAATALRGVQTVRYDFRYGDAEEPTGFATGTTWMEQVGRLEDSRIRVEGTMHAQPRFEVEQQTFVYATDGRRAWSRLGAGDFEMATAGSGNNRLSAQGVYGFLPEFVEDDPLWRERTMAGRVEWTGRDLVDGVECDMIHVDIPLDDGASSSIVWWLGIDDHLPRRGRWISEQSGPRGVTFELHGLEWGMTLDRERFQPPAEARKAETAIAVGELLPPWSLERPDGSLVQSEDLLGQVVVLDFWNTWCPICRSLAPGTHELARRYQGRPVQFFGVNLLEQNDPVAYWDEVQPPYPLLLNGEALADRLDLPWQPGLAVLGADGILIHKQFGASSDRVDRLIAAIETGLDGAGQVER